MRKKQLELYDSGLLPEQMRMRRAAANNLTIYEMVRNSKLYPLEKYLDAADLALERDPKNIATFNKELKDVDEGIRWWAIVGLHLLDKNAGSAKEAVMEALKDKEQEIAMMAAWTLVKIGEEEKGLAFLDKLLHGECTNVAMLHNILDWMGKPGLPLIKKYIEGGGSMKGKYGVVSILGHVAQMQGWEVA